VHRKATAAGIVPEPAERLAHAGTLVVRCFRSSSIASCNKHIAPLDISFALGLVAPGHVIIEDEQTTSRSNWNRLNLMDVGCHCCVTMGAKQNFIDIVDIVALKLMLCDNALTLV